MKYGNIFALLGRKKVFIIAPHPDDAAFSVGGLLTCLDKTEIVIITVFSQNCNSSRAESTTVFRHLEDQLYADFIKAQLFSCGFSDTGIRTNIGREHLRADEEIMIRSDLDIALRSIISKSKNPVVFVPLAIGDHPDHIHCREVLKKCEPDQTIIFYEDMPYGQFVGGPDKVKQIIKQQYLQLTELNLTLTAGQMDRKLQGLDFYKSQLHPKWREDINNYAQALGIKNGYYGERYWVFHS